MRLLLVLLFLPQLLWADQGQILGMARDRKVIGIIKLVNEYCQHFYPELLKAQDHAFLCQLQVLSDCHPSVETTRRSFACEFKQGIEIYSKMVIDSHRSLEGVTKDHIGSMIERITDPCKFEKCPEPELFLHAKPAVLERTPASIPKRP